MRGCGGGTQERKHLALQLKDTKTVVGKLEFMCGVAIHLIFILIYLVIFHVRWPSAPHLGLPSRQHHHRAGRAHCWGCLASMGAHCASCCGCTVLLHVQGGTLRSADPLSQLGSKLGSKGACDLLHLPWMPWAR